MVWPAHAALLWAAPTMQRALVQGSVVVVVVGASVVVVAVGMLVVGA